MKSLSKILSVLLCLAMVLGIFAMTGTAAANDTATLVTDVAILGNGDKVVFMNQAGAYAMGAASSNGNYFTTTAASASNGTVTVTEAMQEITVVINADNTFSFVTEAGKYLVAVDESNYLRENDNLTGLAKWTVSINSDGDAEIVNTVAVKDSNSTPYSLRYNNNNNQWRFSCYGGGQQPVRLYKISSGNPGAPTVNVTGVTIDETATVEVGNTVQLTATVAPDNATNKAVSWTSSNEAVATVSNGKVTGVSAGVATITVTTEDGSKTDTCAVTVTARPTIADGEYIIWNPGSGKALSSVTVNNYYRAGVDVTMDNNVLTGYGDTEVWVVTNNDDGTITIATAAGNKLSMGASFSSIPLDDVNDKWVLNTAADGQYYIKNAGRVGSTLQWYNSNFSTYTNPSGRDYGFTFTKHNIDVTGVTLDKATANLTIGEFTQLVATVAPENATNNTVSWSSSNETIATVDNTGKVTAVAVGTATITVTTADGGETATCTVTVSRPAAESVTMAPTSANIVVGETATLAAVVAPNLADQTVTWTSSNDAVATVDNTGKVTAVAPGTATITATTADGSKSATCAVTVVAQTVPATGVTLDKTTVSVKAGETATLTATVAPENTTDNAIWTSSNTEVATANGGVITAVAPGTATITVTAGTKSATCEVTVTANVTNVTLDKSTADLKVDGEVQLNASVTVNPNQDAYKNVTWTTSDASVATVENGKVKALKAGTVTITATSVTDTTKSASCTVTVTVNTPATQPTTPSTPATQPTTPSTPATTPSTPSTTPNAPAVSTASRIDSLDQLVDGQYILVLDNGNAPGVLDGSWVTAAQPTVSGNKVTDAKGAVWTIKVSGGKVTLTDANGKTIAPKGGNNNGIKEGDYQWDVVCENGKFIFKGVGEDTVRLASNTDPQYANKFRAYKESTATGQYADKYPNAFSLYLVKDEVVPTGDSFQPVIVVLALLSVTAMAVLIINRKRFI